MSGTWKTLDYLIYISNPKLQGYEIQQKFSTPVFPFSHNLSREEVK